MTCDQAELRMAELLAGEIAPEDRPALEKHLLDCASCRGDFELARAGARIEWADVSVPQEVIESTLASFREPPPVIRFLRWATAAAAAFGVAALLVTSSRAERIEAPVAVARPAERPQVLATMQDAGIGALVCKDEEGRPVGELSLKSHEVTVEILDGIAKTTVEENFENHTGRRLEGTFHFPLPSDASISRLALEVNGKIEEGTCLERERAREVFESIVRKAMDPALLEWQPGGFFKCRVFPIEPRSTKRVIVAYTQALPCFQGKMTYVYPLASEKTRTHPPGEASISVQARFSGGLTKIESPSHHLDVQRRNPNEASMAFRATNYRPNNDFVVTLEPGDEEVRVVSHKTDGDDGYFACFAVPRGGGARAPGRYAFVIDASASISAPRLEVAKRLVRAMMERRISGDRFEIIAHNIGVERSGEVDLRAANDFMDRLRPIGGSDVLQALLAAGDAEAIYIGKGAATFGETEPSKILEAVKGRRIRTIAVGSDANGTLLERLGGMMRVSPNDDVARRVAEIAATLGSPVLSDLKVDGGDSVYEVVGVRDLFYGERLIVSGRYRGPAAKLVITGRGYRREVDVAFPAKEEGNNYVRRLWAQRKVSDLLAQGPAKKAEVTELGVKYQIMTPYTSFLVLETEQMWKDFQLKREVQKQDTVLSVEDKTRGVMEEGLALYKQGKGAEASAKFEEAFALKPTSDQVYAFIRRAGEDVVAQIMNAPDRQVQDIGRRLMDLSKPGEPFREGKPVAKPVVPNPVPADPVKTPTLIPLETVKTIQEPAHVFRSRADRFEKSLSPEVERNYRYAASGKGKDDFHLEDPTAVGWYAPAFKLQETARLQSGLHGNTYENFSVGRFERWDESKGVPHVHFTLDHDAHNLGIDSVDIVSPQAGGGASLTGKTSRIDAEESIAKALETINARQMPAVDDNADKQVFVRQLEVQLAQIQELTTKVEEHRAKLAKSGSEKSLAVPEMQHARQTIEKLQQDLAQLEEKHVEMARDKKHLEEKMNAIAQAGGNVNVAPKKALEAKVTAVANEIGLVVISIGKDDGVLEGDEFTVYRGGHLVSKIAVDRSDRKWSAGKVVLKKLDPRVGDDVSNHIFVSASQPRTDGKLRVDAATGDGAWIAVGPMSAAVAPGQVYSVTREGKFVALIQVARAGEARVYAGLAIGRILPGDDVAVVSDPRAYYMALPADVRHDLASRVNQHTIRAKMGLKQ